MSSRKKLIISLMIALIALIAVPTLVYALDPPRIEFTLLGTDSPPATLGGFELFPVVPDPHDPGFVEEEVVSVVPSFAGDLTFITPADRWVKALFAPDGGWNSPWSHGYTGLVFFVNEASTVTIELPANVKAFVVYAEPNHHELYEISVQANDGETYSEDVRGGGGATGFGFHSLGDTTIQTVTITTTDEDFAFAEIYLGLGEDEPVTADVTVNAEKKVVGSPQVMPDFNFMLLPLDPQTGEVIEGGEKLATINGAGFFSFALEGLSVGEHAFLLGEYFDEVDGWTFDETVWFVLVEVYEDGTYDVGYITIDDLDIFLADHEGE
ncbi:MAG: hypothetical protein FWE87_03520, partial [Coriobacteriia bacterium]|nr:hypothetical protein [Coriobacteriia bacterium]